jgi:pimeloyl-ACP methyl ester carboxylesterase
MSMSRAASSGSSSGRAYVQLVPSPDGVDIAVYDFGGSGPPLLLVHATGFCAPLFAPLARRLVAQFRCVGLDLRGHGASSAPADGDFDWNGFARDIMAVLDALAVRNPVGFGHSCGATSLFLAEQATPGTFQQMYCYEPAMAFGAAQVKGAPNAMSMGARRRRNQFASRDEVREYLRSKEVFARFAPDVLEAYVMHGFVDDAVGGLRLATPPENEARTFEHGGSNDALARLGDVHCPVALAYGTAPDSFPDAMATAVYQGLPRAQRRSMHGLGHLGPFEDPAAVAADLIASLAAQ